VPYGSYRIREFYDNGERCYRCMEIMGKEDFEKERERHLGEEMMVADGQHVLEESERVLHSIMETIETEEEYWSESMVETLFC